MISISLHFQHSIHIFTPLHEEYLCGINDNIEITARLWVDLTSSYCCAAGLEFIYAQSPNSMKGLQIGMFYLIYGIFSAVGSTIYFGYRYLKSGTEPDWSVFCLILVILGVVGLVIYIVAALCYKNRRRPATDEADVQRRLMYANVYGSSYMHRI